MKKNMPELAETFLKEANLKIDPNVALGKCIYTLIDFFLFIWLLYTPFPNCREVNPTLLT